MGKFVFVEYDKSKHFQDWNKVNNSKEATFLTSNEWIELQRTLGKEISQFIVYEKNLPIAIFYIEVSRRKIAKYAYLPYSPVFNDDYFGTKNSNELDNSFNTDLLHKFLVELRAFGQNYTKIKNLNLFKIDPYLNNKYSAVLIKTGWKKSLSIGQAREMWEMSLGDDIDKLLSNQKKDTRYYMKRGEKLGVKVKRISSLSEVSDFNKLMKDTEERQGFQNYASGKFSKYWEALNPIGKCNIFIAYKDDTPLAGALMCYQNDKIFYVHGASTSNEKFTKLAAPYILHFEIMKHAISVGVKYYNFWGVVPKGVKHSFRGLSDFKMKFNGYLVSNTGSYEVYSNILKYGLNRLFDFFAFRKDRYNSPN